MDWALIVNSDYIDSFRNSIKIITVHINIVSLCHFLPILVSVIFPRPLSGRFSCLQFDNNMSDLTIVGYVCAGLGGGLLGAGLYKLISVLRDRFRSEPPSLEVIELGSVNVRNSGAGERDQEIEMDDAGYLTPRDVRPHRAQRRADRHQLRPGTPAPASGDMNFGFEDPEDPEDHLYETIDPPRLFRAQQELENIFRLALAPVPPRRERGEGGESSA